MVWLSGTDVPVQVSQDPQVVEVAEIGVRIPVESQLVLVDCIKDRIAEQMVDLPVPPIMEEIAAVVQETVRLVPQGCGQQRIDEQIVELPIPKIMEDIVEEVKIVLCEQIVDVPVLRSWRKSLVLCSAHHTQRGGW